MIELTFAVTSLIKTPRNVWLNNANETFDFGKSGKMYPMYAIKFTELKRIMSSFLFCISPLVSVTKIATE